MEVKNPYSVNRYLLYVPGLDSVLDTIFFKMEDSLL